MQIKKRIVSLKREFHHWGAPKIRERLRRLYPDSQCPAISTVHAMLDRHGLGRRRKRRRHKVSGTALAHGRKPNELWCADYKDAFMLADRRHCYTLTITDLASRYLIRSMPSSLRASECSDAAHRLNGAGRSGGNPQVLCE